MEQENQVYQGRGRVLKTVKAAFPHTIPVITGYLFMGMAFGILLQSNGFHPLWATVMGLVVYSGSMQFVGVSVLAAGFNPLVALAMTLMVNARYMFYGISMLERFGKYKGFARFYMVFSITDETFALLCSAKPPAGVDTKSFYLAISALDQAFWVLGCTLGAWLGTAIPINTTGIDFVMTALFVVIFIDQWKVKANRIPALIGFFGALLCRLVFGPDWFVLASMAALLLLFTIFRKPLEKEAQPK